MRIYNNTGVIVSVAPASMPVSLAEANAYLRLDTNAEDDFVTMLIQASTSMAEEYLRRKIVTQTLQASYDSSPTEDYQDCSRFVDYYARNCKNAFRLPYQPVQSVTDIKIYTSDNTESVYSSDNYFVDTINGRIAFNSNAVLPSNLRQYNSIIVTYVAGYTIVPSALKLGILDQVKAMYDCRGVCDMCEGASRAFAPYRLFDMEM
jgi:uncharacterized phiE125 gp8 family phage protein